MKQGLSRHRWWIIGSMAGIVLVLLYFRHPIADWLAALLDWVSDRDRIRQFIGGFGHGAPLVFMGIQILQVILAPVPGEATGFIGGYLFGTAMGFVYSSAALAVGSWINFTIGRYLGKRFVRRWIPADKWRRFDDLIKHQGIIVLLILFVFPGFPKDYLCLFLGVTAIPLKAFLLIASVGRMPGTLMLSLQGEFLFQKNYTFLVLVFGVTALVAFLSIRYRNAIYRWMEKLNGKPKGNR